MQFEIVLVRLCLLLLHNNVYMTEMNKNFFFIILSIFTYFCDRVSAQNYQALRDSLSKATEALSYKPDSLDLRLKKAGWNILLEQWQYARDEYDFVLKQDPNNIAALFYRAFVNEKQKRYNFARLDYENLIKIVPYQLEWKWITNTMNLLNSITAKRLNWSLKIIIIV